MWLKSISDKLSKVYEKKRRIIFSLAFGLVVTGILWITLLSRGDMRYIGFH